MTQQVADTLNAAADLIETRGWGRGNQSWNRERDGVLSPLCLEGGILAAMGRTLDDEDYGKFDKCPACVAVVEYLQLPDERRPDGQREEPLWRWNDALGFRHMTNPHKNGTPESYAYAKSRVVEVLRATALIAAARERETAEVAR